MVAVPDATGAGSIDYARTIIQQAGFVAVFRARTPTKKEEELKIDHQEPAAGTKAKAGSKVVVVINEKYGEDKVPPLTGLTVE